MSIEEIAVILVIIVGLFVRLVIMSALVYGLYHFGSWILS